MESEGPCCATCGRRPLGWSLARTPFSQLWEERTGRPMPSIVKPKVNSLQVLMEGGRSEYIINKQKHSLERIAFTYQYLKNQKDLFGFAWEKYFYQMPMPSDRTERNQVILEIYLTLLKKLIKEKRLERKKLVNEIPGVSQREFLNYLKQDQDNPIEPSTSLTNWTAQNWQTSPARIEKLTYARRFSWLDKKDLIEAIYSEFGVLVQGHTIDRYLVAIKTELGIEIKKWDKRGGRTYYMADGERVYA